jgi:hypothetical protein
MRYFLEVDKDTEENQENHRIIHTAELVYGQWLGSATSLTRGVR